MCGKKQNPFSREEANVDCYLGV